MAKTGQTFIGCHVFTLYLALCILHGRFITNTWIPFNWKSFIDSNHSKKCSTQKRKHVFPKVVTCYYSVLCFSFTKLVPISAVLWQPALWNPGVWQYSRYIVCYVYFCSSLLRVASLLELILQLPTWSFERFYNCPDIQI